MFVTKAVGFKKGIGKLLARCWLSKPHQKGAYQSIVLLRLPVLGETKTLLSELLPEGNRRLFELWKQIPERRSGQGQPLSPLSHLTSFACTPY